MINYRSICLEDIETYWNLLNSLDQETEFTMYEPEERNTDTDIDDFKEDIKQHVIDGNDFLFIAEEYGVIIGYIRAKRSVFRRSFHTAFIIIGIRRNYAGKGIGTTFFESLDYWVGIHNIKRLELTIQCRNTGLLQLYERNGFEIEGIRKEGMQVNGIFHAEYYMAKLYG